MITRRNLLALTGTSVLVPILPAFAKRIPDVELPQRRMITGISLWADKMCSVTLRDSTGAPVLRRVCHEVPQTFIGLHCGFPVVFGETFKLTTNNGGEAVATIHTIPWDDGANDFSAYLEKVNNSTMCYYAASKSKSRRVRPW